MWSSHGGFGKKCSNVVYSNNLGKAPYIFLPIQWNTDICIRRGSVSSTVHYAETLQPSSISPPPKLSQPLETFSMSLFFSSACLLHPVRAVPLAQSGPAALLRVQGGAQGREAQGLDHRTHGGPRIHQVIRLCTTKYSTSSTRCKMRKKIGKQY